MNTMSEEKKIILRMLREGKITEDEALSLLESIKDTKKKNDYSQFSGFDTTQFVEKFAQAAAKIGKETKEYINNFDFEDISIKFKSNLEQKNKAERVVTENILGEENPKLEVINRNGKINIYSWDNEEVEARADVRFDDRFVSQNYGFIKIEREDNKIIVRPDYDSTSARHFSMNITVAIPKKLFEEIKLESTNSSIDIKEIEANKLKVNSTNGTILLENSVAEIAEVSSTNAQIAAKGISGHELQINTTNGRIVISDVNSSDIDIHTTNGTIVVNGIKDNVRDINTSTNNGNISISIKDVFKPVKAKVKNHFKDIDTNNFADSIFANFVTEDGAMIAYSDGYNENNDKLDIQASTYNGTININ